MQSHFPMSKKASVDEEPLLTTNLELGKSRDLVSEANVESTMADQIS